MKILFDNVNFSSQSGPNSFGRKLAQELRKKGHTVETNFPSLADVQLSFIQTSSKRASKLALRLDGIYFNNRQDWNSLNAPISDSFKQSDIVIYQSNFNKRLTEKYFGEARKSVVINNGTCISDIEAILPIQHVELDKFSELWCCSSSWRPHKRLQDNISYFLQTAPQTAALIVLGENPDYFVKSPRVIYAGQQSWDVCISVYKRCKKFLHLAFLDHCPNVVVDARASGCEIVVASSGGTREIAGPSATVLQDLDWDLRPLDLYSPPRLDYNASQRNEIDASIDIEEVALRYVKALTEI